MAQNSRKSNNHQFDLLDEKRAFVVIALTDRLTCSGKLAALNCLAHYNSEVGYSWASISTAAKESGLSPTSTKTIKRGLDEIVEVGAFGVTKGTPCRDSKKSSTHHYWPIMRWFREEYERLRKVGRLEQDNDEFEGARKQNRSGSQPDQDHNRSGSQPDEIGSTTRSDRVHNPIRSGPQPEEENKSNRTDLREQKEEKSACGVGPADSQVRRKEATNDNESAETRKPDGSFEKNIERMFEDFWKSYPRLIKREEAYKVFREIALTRAASSREIMNGVKVYKQTQPDPKYVPAPAKWLREKRWEEFKNVDQFRCKMAI